MKKLIALFASLIMVSVTANSQNIVKHAPACFDSLHTGIVHGKIDSISYPSKTVGLNSKAMIYLSPGYSKNRKYPALYLLHGIGGDEKLSRRAYMACVEEQSVQLCSAVV